MYYTLSYLKEIIYSRHEGKIIILQTKPNFNTVLAQQITEAFKNEVLCTICSDDKHVIIYYKLKEKADEETEKAKSIYKKSKMRVELRKLCKKYRKVRRKKTKQKRNKFCLKGSSKNITARFFIYLEKQRGIKSEKISITLLFLTTLITKCGI